MEKRSITHEGELDLNGITIPCYVLDDGTRVLSARGMQTAIKLVDGSSVPDSAKLPGAELSRFIGGTWFKSLITSEEKLERFKPIRTSKGRQRINGYEATILADFCDVMLEARKNGLIKSERQQLMADQCEILIRAFAKVGIVALVDEATGYQYDREKDELQKILKAYIGEELLEWRQRFPDEFYREIFRLNGWDFTVKGIKQRPGIIGTWTKQFIYAHLPKGVLPALEKNTPRTTTGKLAKKLHQSLTEETGVPHLEKQLVSVVTLMNISSSWKEFKKYLERKYGQQVLDFDAKGSVPPPLPTNPTKPDDNSKSDDENASDEEEQNQPS